MSRSLAGLNMGRHVAERRAPDPGLITLPGANRLGTLAGTGDIRVSEHRGAQPTTPLHQAAGP